MPPILPRRYARAAGSGAIQATEYYSPIPLTVSGQMTADSRADLLQNQAYLRETLSSARAGVGMLKLIDPLYPSTYYLCTYDGECVFHHAKTTHKTCDFSFKLLANPPFRQSTTLHREAGTYTPANNTARFSVGGKGPTPYKLTAKNVGYQVGITNLREVFRLIPKPGLTAEVMLSRQAPETVSPATLAQDLSPSDLTDDMYIPLRATGLLDYTISAGYPFYRHMCVFMAFALNVHSNALPIPPAAPWPLFEINDGSGGSALQILIDRNNAAGNIALTFSRAGSTYRESTGGPILQQGETAILCVYYGQDIRANLISHNWRPAGTGVGNTLNSNVKSGDILIGRRRTNTAIQCNMDLHAFRIFPFSLSSDQETALVADPARRFGTSAKGQISIPDIPDTTITFDTEEHIGHSSSGDPITPDSETEFSPLQPRNNLLIIDYTSPQQQSSLSRTLVSGATSVATECSITQANNTISGADKILQVGVGSDGTALGNVMVDDVFELKTDGGEVYVAARVVAVGAVGQYRYLPIKASGLTGRGLPHHTDLSCQVKFLRHADGAGVGVTVSYRERHP